MRDRFAKIVATIGPASQSPDMLRKLFETGVDVFRINFSHGTHETHGKVISTIRQIEKDLKTPVCILADLQGPKLRCGEIADGSIEVRYGSQYNIVNADSTDDPQTIPIPHPELFKAIEIGDTIRFDDGKLSFEIISRDGSNFIGKAQTIGKLSSKKGINLPSRTLPISALTEKDITDLKFATDNDVDFIALSFVQRVEDVELARKHINGKAALISKIEKPSAVESLDEIVEASDAIMVARGDLGVELPPEQVPLIQRRIVRRCRAAGKPVIVATHMLESMVESTTPTRAEASDVATATLQGADAVMLSAETAVGRHPPTTVAIMDRIIKAVEADEELWTRRTEEAPPPIQSSANEITLSASRVAEAEDCRVAIAYTTTGSSAQRLSRDRPRCNILAITPDPRTARKLVLNWGVFPIVTPDVHDFEEMLEKSEKVAREFAGALPGDRIVIVAGYPFGRPGSTNTLKISRLE